MARASFQLDDELDHWVQERLVPGQSKSAWYRYAAETIMEVDMQLDQLYEPYEYDKKKDFIEAAVDEKIERAMQKSDKSHEKLVGENGDE